MTNFKWGFIIGLLAGILIGSMISIWIAQETYKHVPAITESKQKPHPAMTIQQDMVSGMLRTYVWYKGQIVKSWMLADARPEQIPMKRNQAIKWAQDVKAEKLDSIVTVNVKQFSRTKIYEQQVP